MIRAYHAVCTSAMCVNKKVLVASMGNPVIDYDSIAYRVVESLPDLPFMRKVHLFADPLSLVAIYRDEDGIILVDVCDSDRIHVMDAEEISRVESKGISSHVVGIRSAMEILNLINHRISHIQKIFVFLPSGKHDSEKMKSFSSMLMDIIRDFSARCENR